MNIEIFERDVRDHTVFLTDHKDERDAYIAVSDLQAIYNETHPIDIDIKQKAY